MSTKKISTSHKASATPKRASSHAQISDALKLRVLDFITDESFDIDSRNAVLSAYKEGDAAWLTEAIELGEKGTLCDTTYFDQKHVELVEIDPEGEVRYAQSLHALAKHIAGIMAHPLTPTDLFNAVGEFICSESSPVLSELEREPEFIARILASCRRGGCANG